MENISDLEKDYLKNIDSEELEAKLKFRDMKVSSLWDYDPREDEEFWKEQKFGDVDFDFSKYDDDMIEDGRYGIAYDEMSEKDIEHFERVFKISDMKWEDGEHKGSYKGWDHLSKETQEKFKEYLTELY